MHDSIEMTDNQFPQNISVELTGFDHRHIFNWAFYTISC